VDVGVAELTFGADETAEALAMFTGHAVRAGDVARVQQASQGWPVAIFLMSQTGRSHDAMASIDEFIEAEVLAPMPKRLRNFVLANAALGSVTVELATAASGQARSAHYLNEAITTVLLQRTPDGWFRFHPLLQDCAIAMLRRENPDLLCRTRSEAARWHCREGHMETAASLALAAGDPQILAEVIWPAARLPAAARPHAHRDHVAGKHR
jgi:serine/threonine-protein kinase PknK